MALKRNSTESMFGVLTKDPVIKKEESIVKRENPVSETKVKVPVKEEKPVIEEKEEKNEAPESPVTKEIEVAEETVNKEENASETAENRAPSFIAKAHLEKKEIKSVRKQFVLTPTQAAWLKETASANGISENKVIELLIKNAAEEN